MDSEIYSESNTNETTAASISKKENTGTNKTTENLPDDKPKKIKGRNSKKRKIDDEGYVWPAERLQNVEHPTKAQMILYANPNEYPYKNKKMLLKDEINPKKRRTDEIENILKNAREQLERCDLSTKRSIANQMMTYINMAKETFHDSMKTVEDDIERAIILMQEETLDAMDYLCQSKNKEIIRKLYEKMEKKIIELEKENLELKNTIITARSEKAKMAGILNEVNNKLKRLECKDDETRNENAKEIIKCRIDYMQKIKKTEKRGAEEDQTTNKKPKTETEGPSKDAVKSPEIIVLEN